MVTYSCERSEKKTSASAPSPGSTTSYSTSSPADRLGQRGDVERDRHARRADLHVLDEDVERQRRGVGQRGADRLRDPAPVRVPAVQRGLHQRRVGDRPRGARDDLVAAAAHDHAADPLGALAVAHDVQRELAQRPVQRLAEAHLVLGLRLDRARRDAPDACRITVSLVESCPSTETRSNERCDAHAEQQVGGLGASSTASVWTKQSIVANAGEIIPAPLACAVSRTVPDGSATSTSTSLANLSVVRIASEKSPWPYSRSSPRARAMPRIDVAGVQQHADHAGGGDRDLVLAHAAGHRRRALHARRLLEAAVAGGRVGVAGVGDDHADRVQPRALLGQHDRRGEHAGAREARRAHAVRRRADQQADVQPARRLEPAATPAARKPAGRSPGFSVTCSGISSQRELISRSLRLRPAEHQVEVLHGLRRRALPQVVDRREDDDPARPRVRDATRSGSSSCRARRSRRPGRSRSSTNGSRAYASSNSSASSSSLDARATA